MPSHHPFPATAWTQILTVQAGSPASAEALEGLCGAYWPAIYTYLRVLGCEREEARDLTQDFLTEFVTGQWLQNLSPERGRLRSYMMQALRNHLANHRRDASRLKRGGGQGLISLSEMEDFDPPEQASSLPPEAWFDRRWAWTIMQQALGHMEASYTRRGKGQVFEALKPCLMGTENVKPYAEIGADLGMKESAIKLEIHRARRRLAEALRVGVAATIEDQNQVESELRYLLAVLGGTQ